MSTEPSAEMPRCIATTRSGKPCRNLALESQQYCFVHLPKNGAKDIVEQELPIQDEPQPEPVLDAAHANANEAVHELEVKIRNHEQEAPVEARDMALDMLRLVRENMLRLNSDAAQQVSKLLKGGISSDYLDPDFWHGIGMVLEYQLNEIRGLLQRRLHGEYSTDAYGMDSEVVELLRPVGGFLYRRWWRVNCEGIENVPGNGAALLLANHSGMLPWDGIMIATAILEEHADPRLPRTLHQQWMSTIPFLAPALAALGQVPALSENAERLLSQGELVSVFPEGSDSSLKLFRDRYRIRNFEATTYIRAALRAGAPIIPVSVIGAEEAYPILSNFDRLGKMLGLPYLPITPFFPWLGPLGLLPLPSKWTIIFGSPVDISHLQPEDAHDEGTVNRLVEIIRERIQSQLQRGLSERKSVF